MIYRAYGLTFDSEVPIPALDQVPADPCADQIHFQLGAPCDWVAEALSLPSKKVPTRRGDAEEPRFELHELGERCFYRLRFADGTRFVVDQGATRIWGEPGPGLTDEDAAVYLLGSVMGFVLRKRGRSALHASAVAIGGSAAALVGSAGAGKSTTAAALSLRGWPVLCEDVCALEQTGGRFNVLPGYPRVCLWPDSVAHLFSSPQALPLIVAGWEKRYLPLDGSRAQFAAEKLPLAAIYLLAPRSGDLCRPVIEPISQRAAALRLVQNTYMNWLLDTRERAAEFDQIAALVSRVPCFQLTPSSDPSRLAALAELIETHARQHSGSMPARAVHPNHANV